MRITLGRKGGSSVAKRSPDYPFVPKSTAYLVPGQFWSIPLDSGVFACGRVLQLDTTSGKPHSRIFLAGLMDWWGILPPTVDSLAGRSVLEQGTMHVAAIGWNGWQILGLRDLRLDGIEPGLVRDAHVATYVQRGFDYLRPAQAEDAQLPVFSAWGPRVMKIAAEQHFGGLTSVHPESA